MNRIKKNIKEIITFIKNLSPDHNRITMNKNTELRTVLHGDDWKKLAKKLGKSIGAIQQYHTIEALAKIL